MTTCPLPQHPKETGVHDLIPDVAQLEGAHLLANEARPFLSSCGFSEVHVLEWALSYIAEQGSGDVESFVTWIHECEGTSAI